MTNSSCLITNPILDSVTTWFDLSVTPFLVSTVFVSVLLAWDLKVSNPKHWFISKLTSVALTLSILTTLTIFKFLNTDITLNMLSGQIWTFVFSVLLIQGGAIVGQQITGKNISVRSKLLEYLLLLPIILFTPTKLNITAFNLSSCQSVVSPFVITYISLLACFLLLRLLVIAIKNKANNLHFTPLILGSITIFVSVVNFLLSTQNQQVEKSLPIIIFMWFIYLYYTIINTDKNLNLYTRILPHEIILLFVSIFLTNFLFYSDWQTVLNLTTLMIIITFFSVSLAIRLCKKQINTNNSLKKSERQTKKLKTRISLLEDTSFSNLPQLVSSLRLMSDKNDTLLQSRGKTLSKQDASTLIHNQIVLKEVTKQLKQSLLITKLESNKFQHHWTDFNLKETVSDVCDTFRPLAIKKGLVLIFRTALNNHPVVFNDKDQIRQVLHLLLEKSINDSKTGIIRVLLHDNHKTKKFFIDVTSSSYGLDIKTQKDILQSFYKHKIKPDSNSKIIRELYLINLIVKKLGGVFSIYSQGKNKGVRFTIDLPYEVIVKNHKPK